QCAVSVDSWGHGRRGVPDGHPLDHSRIDSPGRAARYVHPGAPLGCFGLIGLRSKVRWSLFLLALASVASVLTAPRESRQSHKALLTDARIDSHTRELLERCCRDCHSEATRYPWYSYVAPVSWWIQRDVSQGRLHLDL